MSASHTTAKSLWQAFFHVIRAIDSVGSPGDRVRRGRPRAALGASIPTSIGRVTSRPRRCRAHRQVGDEVDFPSSCGHRQWMLHPVDADFEATTLQDSAKRTRLIISATRYSPDYPAKALARAVSVVGVGAGIAEMRW